MADKNGYYDFEEELLSSKLTIDEIFYSKDVKQRKIFIDDINYLTAFDPVRHILQYNKEDEGVPVEERKPILLYIASNGGSVDAGFEIIDAIKTSRTPVYTINLGFQYSMGCLIGMAGHKRFAMPNAKFLIHDGSNMIWDSGAKAHDTMKFYSKLEERTKNFILSNTKITPEEYDEKYRIEWYMFADEAKEKGLIDCIVGADCDIEMIV